MEVKGLREYFREKWLPKALILGMSEEQFWESNPRKMKPYMDAYKERERIIDSNNWSLGIYIRAAIASALDKRSKYPEKPYLEEAEEKRIIDGSNMSEEEQELARKRIMQSMGLPTAFME